MEQSKQIIISHRGNITGPNTAVYGENHPNSIKNVLDMGFYCEVDVRWVEGEGIFLGHDKPEYKIDKKFLYDHRLYIHCKDVITLYKLNPQPITYIKMFFHQNDDIAVIINSDLLWSFPRADVILTPKSIAVLPELVDDWEGLNNVAGVCTDYPIKYSKADI